MYFSCGGYCENLIYDYKHYCFDKNCEYHNDNIVCFKNVEKYLKDNKGRNIRRYDCKKIFDENRRNRRNRRRLEDELD